MKDLCISLIRDDLTNLRLVYGLAGLQIPAEQYMLHLSETVFSLMGFDIHDRRTDAIYVHYDELARKVTDIRLPEERQELHALALTIYERLVEWKEGTGQSRSSLSVAN
jgi:hypothetical protein